MTRFMVFEPPGTAGAPRTEGASEDAVFVRDRFSAPAFLFAPLWLLRYGLVVQGVLVLLLGGWLLYLARSGLGLVAVPLIVLLGLLVALEGPEWRARRLLRRRYRDAGAVEAQDAAEAAILYFAGHAVARTASGRSEAALPWAFEPVAPEPKRRRWWPFARKAHA
ncbi:DUF2628 domain-containing protein [Aureimonas leprariae]|uniref:DUF2628 domain-containing protein n=1 Tax=Plantimonas leprariae TaxID=2615207 RepID=A0A7V7TUK8_9HYPH|nr:DUF2628 domain-containing protein [Aureimonas leprariae]KAB0676111.1 DUF2628 domain-containing protein [Aureimonas leprariae]